MLKRKLSVLIMLPLILILSACAGLKLPGTSSGTSTGVPQGQNQPGQPFDFSQQPLEQKLAIGTLKLEGTDKAVTKEQAKDLLPLWKGIKALSSDSKTAQSEIDAVYKQIEEALTPEQMDAIKNLSLTPEDTQALMQQYGIRGMRAGAPNQSGTPFAPPQTNNGSSSGRNQTGRQGGSFPGGGFPEGGAPGGGFPQGGFPGGESQFNGQRTPNAQRTPRSGMPNGGFRGGMNFMFIDPLIKVLQDRAGVPVTPAVTPTP